MALEHLSTSTPASEVSRADFERDDMGNSGELNELSFDDILRNSPAAEILGLKQQEESLPEEDDDASTPDESEGDAPDTSEESEKEVDEEAESEDSEEDKTGEDDQESTQDAELPSEEDIDWEYKVPVTIDGKTEYLSLEEIRKGYATDKHLSQKGRELGDLKKQVEQERTEKLETLVKLGTQLHEKLMVEENFYAQEYHERKKAYEKAVSDGDTYEARELKDKLQEAQQEYWKVRKEREGYDQTLAEKIKANQEEQQQKLLEQFNKDILEVIPGFSEKVATDIRSFAIKEGIPEGLLGVIYDAKVIKFIDDYRKLKQKADVGSIKRKSTPSKSIPTKKGTPQSERQKQADSNQRAKVLSGDSSQKDQLDFLKRISKVSQKL